MQRLWFSPQSAQMLILLATTRPYSTRWIAASNRVEYPTWRKVLVTKRDSVHRVASTQIHSKLGLARVVNQPGYRSNTPPQILPSRNGAISSRYTNFRSGPYGKRE